MPVSAVPFISIDDLGDLLGEDLSASDAAQIAVDAACDLARDEADQTFNVVNNDEVVLDGEGTETLLLPQRPVLAVDSVVVGEETLTVIDDYILNAQGILFRVPRPAVWPMGRQNVTVVYDHGYSDDDFPRSVRATALDIAKRIYESGSVTSGVNSESEALGAYSHSVTYAAGAVRAGEFVTEGHRRVLRKYKSSRSF